MSTPENSNTPKLHPHFANQIADWRPTLLNRFYATLARVTQELDANVFHAPQRVLIEVSNYIGEIKHTDCIAKGDVGTFDKCCNLLVQTLQPLKRIE
jgi:hypothetical protein